MKRALSLCLFFAVSSNVAQCAVTYFPPLQPANPSGMFTSQAPAVVSPYANSLSDPGVNYPQLDRIERSLYRRVYSNQDISSRLARLERSIFNTTYPSASFSQRVDNIVGNFNQINQYRGVSTNSLSRLESRLLNQNYVSDTPEERISRLEEQVFGAVQNGDLNSRYARLKIAANKYDANQYNQYSNQMGNNLGTQGGWKNVLGGLGSMFLGGGAMTGFTPPIDPFYGTMYNSYSPSMMSPPMSGYGYSSGYSSGTGLNRGFYNGFRNTGSGAGVTILD